MAFRGKGIDHAGSLIVRDDKLEGIFFRPISTEKHRREPIWREADARSEVWTSVVTQNG